MAVQFISGTSVKERIRVATRTESNEPCIFSKQQFDLTAVDAFVLDHNEAHPNKKISYMHFVLKSVGIMMTATPINGILKSDWLKPLNKGNIYWEKLDPSG